MTYYMRASLIIPSPPPHSQPNPLGTLVLAIPELVQHWVTNDYIRVILLHIQDEAPLVLEHLVSSLQGSCDVWEVLDCQLVALKNFNPAIMQE